MIPKENDSWETPQTTFEFLNDIFNFDLDVASSHKNHKTERYFTYEDNALIQNWNGRVWCNPPYSHPLQEEFVKKAIYEVNSNKNCEYVVMLIPATTDTSLFHDLIVPNAHIYLIKGRISFNIDGKPKGTPRQASMICVFKKHEPYTSSKISSLTSVPRKD